MLASRIRRAGGTVRIPWNAVEPPCAKYLRPCIFILSGNVARLSQPVSIPRYNLTVIAAEASSADGAMMRLKQVCLAGAVFLSLTQSAEAQNFNQLVGFGDSTIDPAGTPVRPAVLIRRAFTVSMRRSRLHWRRAETPTPPVRGSATRKFLPASSAFQQIRPANPAERTSPSATRWIITFRPALFRSRPPETSIQIRCCRGPPPRSTIIWLR